ncbi:MAG TPA: BatD family protein, partial [Candidatus Marinimicrobia bacterium]|nr:BatD family protein [Candidatus Neomarinimicrobiota bacterium]
MIRAFIFSLMATLIWADESVNVTVDRRDIVEGESITLTVTTNNVKSDPELQLPEMPDFKVVSGPNQSSSTNVQFINGKMTKNSTITLSWNLIPKRTGQLTIPAMKIQAGKKSYLSTPITISVSKRGSSQAGKVAQFFIEAKVDNNTPYRGEQTTLTYTLYTKVDVTSFDDDVPSFKGFWTEELYAPKNLKLREERKNGVKYYAATIKKIALFPTQSGEIIIEPMSAVIGIREKQQRWNDFSLFGPPSKKYTVSTRELSIDVKPLPARENGNISAIVGNWNIKSEVSTSRIKQDEAITFKVIINGTGNLQTVDMTEIYFPNELEVFDPEIESKENPLRDKIGGEKKFEWVLIPRFAGDIFIPKIQLNYFDPKQGKWVTKSTSRHKLNVAPNEKALISSIGLSKEEVELMGEDIRFIDESQPKWRNRNRALVTGTALTFLLLSGMVFAFPHAQNITKQRMEKSSGGWQARRALISAFGILDSAPDS